MMNMMDRFVEGRAHVREIDMLLELTCVVSCAIPFAPRRRYRVVLGGTVETARQASSSESAAREASKALWREFKCVTEYFSIPN